MTSVTQDVPLLNTSIEGIYLTKDYNFLELAYEWLRSNEQWKIDDLILYLEEPSHSKYLRN